MHFTGRTVGDPKGPDSLVPTQRNPVHVRHGSSKLKTLPDTTNSQKEIVRHYLKKNIFLGYPENSAFQLPILNAKLYGKMTGDWSTCLKSMPSTDHYTCRPKTTRSVATGLPNRRVSKVHVGCTVSTANRDTQLQQMPKLLHNGTLKEQIHATLAPVAAITTVTLAL